MSDTFVPSLLIVLSLTRVSRESSRANGLKGSTPRPIKEQTRRQASKVCGPFYDRFALGKLFSTVARADTAESLQDPCNRWIASNV